LIGEYRAWPRRANASRSVYDIGYLYGYAAGSLSLTPTGLAHVGIDHSHAYIYEGGGVASRRKFGMLNESTPRDVYNYEVRMMEMIDGQILNGGSNSLLSLLSLYLNASLIS
jgi:hypothetical protein